MKQAFLAGGPLWIFVKCVTIVFTLVAVSQLLPGPNRQVPGYQARPLRAMLIWAGSLVAAAALAVGCATAVSHVQQQPDPDAAPLNPDVAHPSIALGFFAPGVNTSWKPEAQFTAETGAPVSYVLSYSAWPAAPFNGEFAAEVSSHGAVPVIQILPHVPLSEVADGKLDAQVRSYADEARSFGHPVDLSFAPEANGNWYKWGYGHTSPATWVAAWRHMVTVFRQQHASNVTWLWTVNVPFPHSGAVSDYWPGDAYVGMVGLDGYYAHPTDTFANLFGPLIREVRALTSKPIFVSETAAGPDSGKQRETQIRGLFTGVKADHLTGFLWFDEAQTRALTTRTGD